jgi:hypothetical protein
MVSSSAARAPGHPRRYAREGEMMMARPPRQAALAPQIGKCYDKAAAVESRREHGGGLTATARLKAWCSITIASNGGREASLALIHQCRSRPR